MRSVLSDRSSYGSRLINNACTSTRKVPTSPVIRLAAMSWSATE
jgi:hypothetical protein